VGVEDGFRSRSWLLVSMAALRGLLTASVLVALYYLLPLDFDDSGTSEFVKLAVGALVFVALMAWQLRAITQSKTPGLRALEALFLAVPLFLILFATAYYAMSQGDTANFTAPLTRTDALYFTVTIFSTVGFGDISARAESARLVVTAQMMLDLIVLGVGVKIILGTVQRTKERLTTQASAEPASP
jgi:voltage-gated potassium channel